MIVAWLLRDITQAFRQHAIPFLLRRPLEMGLPASAAGNEPETVRAYIWPSFKRHLIDRWKEALRAQNKNPFAPHLMRCYVCIRTTHAGA
jgi:hypothetical protein